MFNGEIKQLLWWRLEIGKSIEKYSQIFIGDNFRNNTRLWKIKNAKFEREAIGDDGWNVKDSKFTVINIINRKNITIEHFNKCFRRSLFTYRLFLLI